MRNLLKFIVILGSLSLLAACQSTPETLVCEDRDWFEYGRQYGASGYSYDYASKNLSCELNEGQKSEITLGVQKGLRTYCTYSNGYLVGRMGEKVQNDCPSPLGERFAAGFAKGSKVYFLEEEIIQIDATISNLKSQLGNVTSSAIEKSNLKAQISQLESKKQENQKNLSQLGI